MSGQRAKRGEVQVRQRIEQLKDDGCTCELRFRHGLEHKPDPACPVHFPAKP